VVVVWVKVWGCFLGYRAVACPCLCRLVESSSCVFTVIGYDGYVRRVMRFRRCFRSVGLDGRSWRSLMILEGIVGTRVGHSRCRDRQ
jgi:hypothetical protein